MPKGRRVFKRRPPTRVRRKLFLVASEGDVTEELYFKALNSDVTVDIKPIPSKNRSSPKGVLANLHKERRSLEKGDERWIVVDLDSWSDEELKDVFDLCKVQGIGMAVSNPQFELWLLLHFENGNGANTKKKCLDRLNKYIPGFSKKKNKIPRRMMELVPNAIKHAKQKDSPPTRDWPRTAGSTVYRLVENILK